MHPRLTGLLVIMLLSGGSILALTGLRQFFVQPLATSSSNLIWFTAQIAPLLAVLPGVLRLKPRSLLLTCLVSMLYFVQGVLIAATQELRNFGLWEVGFALILLAASVVTLRMVPRPGNQGADSTTGC